MEATAKTKNAIFAQYNAVFAIAQKNGVQMQALQAQMQALHHLVLRVPVIGALNVGKSTLLNALLSYPLLPTGVTAKTLVPTALSYGEPMLMVQRGGAEHRAGLGELRSKYFDANGVSALHAFYPSACLQALDGLQLVDMPSFDVATGAQAEALTAYLAQSFGCILLVSAEEPVLKESVCRCLQALRLRDIPFYILLTKCDKVTPAACKEGVRFCQQAMQEQLRVENVPVLCVQAHPTPQFDAAQQLLETLNHKADMLCYAHYSDKLAQHIADLIDLLQMLSLQKEVAVAALETRSQALQQRSAELDGVIADWETAFLQCVPQYQDALLAQMAEKITAFAPVIETEMMSRHADPAKTYTEMVSLATSLIKTELEPLLQTQLRTLQTTMVYHFAQQGGELPASLASSMVAWHADAPLGGLPVGERAHQGAAITPPVHGATSATPATLMACCVAQMHQTQLATVLEQAYAALPARPRAKAVRAQVHQELLPLVSRQMQDGIAQTAASYCTQLCAQVHALFWARCNTLTTQLAQTIALCGNQMSQQQQGLADTTADIAALHEIAQSLA